MSRAIPGRDRVCRDGHRDGRRLDGAESRLRSDHYEEVRVRPTGHPLWPLSSLRHFTSRYRLDRPSIMHRSELIELYLHLSISRLRHIKRVIVVLVMSRLAQSLFGVLQSKLVRLCLVYGVKTYCELGYLRDGAEKQLTLVLDNLVDLGSGESSK